MWIQLFSRELVSHRKQAEAKETNTLGKEIGQVLSSYMLSACFVLPLAGLLLMNVGCPSVNCGYVVLLLVDR